MRNPLILSLVLLIALLTGCKELGSLKMAQDRPEDIQKLLEHHEFYRVRQLLERHPSNDTEELRIQLSTLEIDFENSTYRSAFSFESDNDLFGAVQLLSGAIQKHPNSKILLDYRNRLEEKRQEKIRANETRQLIARAEYILNQRAYFMQQHNLEASNLIERWEQTRNKKESGTLSAQLNNHGEYAFSQGDLDTAQKCLELSNSLDENPAARELLDQMAAATISLEENRQQKTIKTIAKKKQKIRKTQTRKSEKLITEARKALESHQLVTAHELLLQISSPENSSEEVRLLQEKLDIAINTQVKKLTARGDREYRSDYVVKAINAWTEALKLDKENQYLKERLDRAGRVLAKLEQIKQQQRK